MRFKVINRGVPFRKHVLSQLPNLICMIQVNILTASSFSGLIILCSVLGIATGKLGEAGRPFVLFFKASSDIIIMVLRWFVW